MTRCAMTLIRDSASPWSGGLGARLARLMTTCTESYPLPCNMESNRRISGGIRCLVSDAVVDARQFVGSLARHYIQRVVSASPAPGRSLNARRPRRRRYSETALPEHQRAGARRKATIGTRTARAAHRKAFLPCRKLYNARF